MITNPHLADSFGRQFPYVRLSITDICNFRCTYCLPDGYQKGCSETFLGLEEIKRLVKGLASLGVSKIRLTGGEPTLRPDFLSIASMVARTPGIHKVALTTNGYHLPERASDYYNAGVRSINISIDSLHRNKFHAITGHDRLSEVLDGISACLEAGFEQVKINTVLLKGINDDELDSFLSFVATQPISLRFIELMRTRENSTYFNTHHLSGSVVTERLLNRGWRQRQREFGAGPALEFEHDSSLGTIGLIAPYSKDFCKSCNRLRISAVGALHLCLFGEGGYSLRPWLQEDDQESVLTDKIVSLLRHKQASHLLEQGNSGVTRNLAAIGG